MKIAIKQGGRYLTAEGGGGSGQLVTCNRLKVGPWEEWTIERLDQPWFALRSCDGFYLGAVGGGGGDVHIDATQIGPWEQWRQDPPGSPQLRSWEGDALRVGPGPVFRVSAQRNPALASELTFEILDADEQPQTPAPNPAPTGDLARINVAGHRLQRNGQPWFLKGASFFRGYEKFLGGEDLGPQLTQLQALGCNTVRVWSMYHYLNVNDRQAPAFNMATMGDRAYDQLVAFHALLARYGLYSYWTGFCDPRIVLPDAAAQQRHWNRLVDVLEGINNVAAIELNNEQDAHDFNQVDRGAFRQPPSRVSICSSWGEDLPPAPHWSGFDYHHPRDDRKSVKDACVIDHPGYVLGRFVLLGEPVRDPGVDQARQMAGTASGTAAGIVYHSQRGKHAELLEGDSPRAFFGALAAV